MSQSFNSFLGVKRRLLVEAAFSFQRKTFPRHFSPCKQQTDSHNRKFSCSGTNSIAIQRTNANLVKTNGSVVSAFGSCKINDYPAAHVTVFPGTFDESKFWRTLLCARDELYTKLVYSMRKRDYSQALRHYFAKLHGHLITLPVKVQGHRALLVCESEANCP